MGDETSWRILWTCWRSVDHVHHHVMFAHSTFRRHGQTTVQCKTIQLTQTYVAWLAAHGLTSTSVFWIWTKKKQPRAIGFPSLIFNSLLNGFGTQSVPRSWTGETQFCIGTKDIHYFMGQIFGTKALGNTWIFESIYKISTNGWSRWSISQSGHALPTLLCWPRRSTLG